MLFCLGLAAVSSVALIVTLSNRISVVNDVRATNAWLDRAVAADDAVQAAAIAWLVAFVACAAAFIVWVWRCAKNAEALERRGPRFGPGWAIGGWFIPIANFVIPVLLIQDLWRATDAGAARGTDWRQRSASPLVGWWWAALLIGSVVSRSSGSDAETLDAVKSSDSTTISGSVIVIIAAVLAALLVYQLTERFGASAAEARAQAK